MHKNNRTYRNMWTKNHEVALELELKKYKTSIRYAHECRLQIKLLEEKLNKTKVLQHAYRLQINSFEQKLNKTNMLKYAYRRQIKSWVVYMTAILSCMQTQSHTTTN